MRTALPRPAIHFGVLNGQLNFFLWVAGPSSHAAPVLCQGELSAKLKPQTTCGAHWHVPFCAFAWRESGVIRDIGITCIRTLALQQV